MLRLFILAFAAIAPFARAQCTPGFLTGDQIPGVTAGADTATVRAALEWDFDGAGPQPSKLVVAGTFTEAGGLPASNLALWDGQLWSSFGAGANGTISRLVGYNGEIIAAGAFTVIGGVSTPDGLAAFDGTNWRAFPAPGGTPTQLLSWNGLLYACGPFVFNGTPGNYVASFDGANWSPVGGRFDGQVNDVAPYNGQLMAGGAFTTAGTDAAFCLARWDGAHWSTFQGGTNDGVNCIKQFGPDLYVGGVFSAAGSPSVMTRCCAKWDGTAWTSVMPSNVLASVNCLGGTETVLVAGGVAVHASHYARYHPVAGSGVPTGTGALNGLSDTRFEWIGSYQNRLHVAGSFRSYVTFAGDIQHFGISRMIDGKWHALTGGLNGRFYSVETYRGQTFAVGDFTRWKETPVRSIVRWDGTDWVQFNTNFPPGSDTSAPNLLKSWHDRLYIYAPSGAPLQAYWNGSVWTNNDILVPNSGMLVEFVGDRLMAAVNSGWRQTSAFSPYAYGSVFTQPASCSIPYAGGYVVGGAFTTANGAPALRVVYSDGNTWTPMGAGFNSYVSKLLMVDGQPAAFGGFYLSGSTPVGGAARWDGAAWQPMGGGLTSSATYSVKDATTLGGDVYAVGVFTDFESAGLMRYDGAAWSSVGSLPHTVITPFSGGERIFTVGDEAWILGKFTHAGGQPSYQFARYRAASAAPHIDVQPAHAAVHRGDPVSFSITASGDGTLTYDWRRDGVSIGAPSLPTLAIEHAADADRGLYDCVVSNGCGTPATSTPARLTVLTADLGQQGGDAGGDNLWNNNDFVVFIDLFFSQDAAADLGRQGGLPGGDGAWDNNDFVVFIDLFFAGY